MRSPTTLASTQAAEHDCWPAQRSTAAVPSGVPSLSQRVVESGKAPGPEKASRPLKFPIGESRNGCGCVTHRVPSAVPSVIPSR